MTHLHNFLTRIIESVDSVSRDGPDSHIYVIHYKGPKFSELVNFQYNLEQIIEFLNPKHLCKHSCMPVPDA